MTIRYYTSLYTYCAMLCYDILPIPHTETVTVQYYNFFCTERAVNTIQFFTGERRGNDHFWDEKLLPTLRQPFLVAFVSTGTFAGDNIKLKICADSIVGILLSLLLTSLINWKLTISQNQMLSSRRCNDSFSLSWNISQSLYHIL